MRRSDNVLNQQNQPSIRPATSGDGTPAKTISNQPSSPIFFLLLTARVHSRERTERRECERLPSPLAASAKALAFPSASVLLKRVHLGPSTSISAIRVQGSRR